MSRKPTGTKKKVLDSACELVAQKGYKDVTHQEICEKAGANIASINYYFGTKENLYLAVWEYASALTAEKYYRDGFDATTPEERIEYYVDARISAVMDDGPAGWLPRIIHREMANPSELHEELGEKYMKSKLELLTTLVKDFLGEGASEMNINCARFSLHSQCVHMNIARTHKRAFFAGNGPDDKDAVKAEMIKIIMGGLYSYRYQLKRGE